MYGWLKVGFGICCLGKTCRRHLLPGGIFHLLQCIVWQGRVERLKIQLISEKPTFHPYSNRQVRQLVTSVRFGKKDKAYNTRVSRSYFVLFFGKCPILSYFLAILPLILVFYSLLSPLFHVRTFLNFF